MTKLRGVQPLASSTRLLALLLAVALLGGCAGGGGTSGGGGAGGATNRDHVYDASAAPGSSASGQGVTGIAEDRQGDTATITIGVAEPQSLADGPADVREACNQQVAAVGSSADRSVVVPVSVAMRVTSSLGADVAISLSGVHAVTTDGLVSLPDVPVLWAASYGGAPTTCDVDTSLGAATVHWDADTATPDSLHTWNAWIVLPGAVSPNDPSGSDQAGRLVFSPFARLSGNLAGFQPEVGSSDHLVRCSASDPAAGLLFYVAVDGQGALGAGCTAPQPPQAETERPKEADDPRAECVSAYPNGDERTVHVTGGKRTLYDRQASLFQVVCNDFGAPQDVELTPGMQCALIAAAATYGGPPGSGEAADRLCDVNTVVEAYRSGHWLGAAAGEACGYLSGVFAGGSGVFAAGLASETGPGAVAVGVGTYKALYGTLKVVCGGLFEGGAHDLGTKIEADHETHVAVDVIRHGKCLVYSRRLGRSSWKADDC